MSNLIRSNLNLLKSLGSWRLSLNTFPKGYNYSQLTSHNVKNSYFNGSKHYATAQGYKTNGELGFKENAEFLGSKDASLKSIDETLYELDQIVKRTGRTLRRTVEKICSMIEDRGLASQTQSLYLLRACTFMYNESPKSRVEMADQVWNKLQSLGTQFDVRHFNSLLRIYVENQHNFLASEFLARMEKHKIDPNKATFLSLLDKYANDGDVNGASEILEFMKEKGLPINEAVFNSLIKCHMKARDASGAKDILEVMRSSYAPSADTYTALACGYAEHGEVKELNSVFKEAENNNIYLSVPNYLSIITSLPVKQSDFVDKVLEKIEDIPAWRQAVLNCMIDLINKDKLDTAFKLLLTIATKNETNSTNNFLKQLIRSEQPIEKVMEYCEKIYSQQLNEFTFVNCAKNAIELEKFDYAVALFDELQKRGIPVRCSFFWQLFDHYKDSEQGIWLILKKMQELGIPPDYRTLEEFIFPAISLKNPQEVLSKIQDTGLSVVAVIDPLFQYYCCNGQFRNALYLAENYTVRIYASFDWEMFLSLYERSNYNSSDYYDILNFLLRPNKFLNEIEASTLQGKQLAFLIEMNPTIFQNFIKREQNRKDSCKFNERAIEACWNILNRKNPQRLNYLRVFQKNQPQTKVHKTVEQEEKELNLMKERGVSTETYLLSRLRDHVTEKNIPRIKELRAELDNLGVIYPPVTYAQLLSLYCDVNDKENADNAYLMLKEKYPDFGLDSNKTFIYAEVLIRFSKLDEAKKLIERECREMHIFGSPDIVAKSIRRLFIAAIETGDCEFVKSIQDSLLSHAKSFEMNTFFYEPLIRVHLLRNDLDSAISEFRKCVSNHRVLPRLTFLLKKCIVADDQQCIKSVINIASQLIPEHAALYELAIAFMDSGRKTQALSVIQSIKNKNNPIFIEDICMQLYKQKRVLELEEFLPLVQDVENLGKEKIFYHLFKLYDERNDFKRSLELYQHIEKEKLFDPSDRIKALLSSLLARNNQSSSSSLSMSTPLNSQNTELVTSFVESVTNKNVSEALEKLQNLKKGIIQSIPSIEMSNFIELLVQEKRTNDFQANSQAMSCIIANASFIVKPLLEKYSASGDTESLKALASFVPDFTLKKVFFNSYYARSHFVSEKYEDLLSDLETNQSKGSSKLFCIAAFEGLLQHSEFEERVLKLAKGYLNANFDLPISIVWALYFAKGNLEKAKDIFKMHKIPVEKVDSLILKVVRQDSNIELGRAYIDELNLQSGIKTRTKERSYGTLLDVLVSNSMWEEATALLADAKQNGVNLENSCPSSLITLKSALENENKEIPSTVPS
ncbi:hypothetical protein JTE90_028650 [Oedothorax gibbosus]|uniref:Pentatricopeptide repeat-containing protein-mitochondrial domain-containing protein n=1 Tax=Oedothorax gibbosus TaxID=931172 RepID=A0AAV6UZD3_9ARAC|nr:hypothetical protein JTE90_028650 [Oedothorax gibbosus]